MTNFRDAIKNLNLKVEKITIKKGATILTTPEGKIVLKKKKRDDLDIIYSYLKSRSFDYFPNKYSDPNYDIFDYIEDVQEPKEQKMEGLIYLIGLLHSKTTFYKEVDTEDYKYIYEEVNKEIDSSFNYLNTLMENVTRETYMSPASYLLARNLTALYRSLDKSKGLIESWHLKVDGKRKIRYVNIHGNLSMDHYLKKGKPYLISWDKSKIDLPIYDIISLYRNHYLDFDFVEILKIYESKYPLLDEEKDLMFALLLLPRPISLYNDSYTECVHVRKYLDYIEKTYYLASEYRKEKEP